ncbi:MAG: carbohydrate ABC transporter permease [Clostridia bacterium]|nr:carbohydrate ABC transporter permease [Clostridia bacterium]
MIKNKANKFIESLIVNIVLVFVTLTCIIPFAVVLSASLSEELTLAQRGYSIIPRGFTLDAYKVVFKNAAQILSAYGVTIVTTAIGATLGVLIAALSGYPLSRTDYKWRKYFSFYFYFTMIFSGGAISSYIWITQGLNLRNNPLVLILPSLVSAWNIFMMRTYMSKIPKELIEAATIDGAGEYKIFFKIILPMNVVGLATMFIMTALTYWNQWYPCLMYLSDDKYVTLQYYLIRVMSNIDFLSRQENAVATSVDISKMPSETARMAICVVSAGPMIFVFSFFQKYFTGGIALGSVKG